MDYSEGSMVSGSVPETKSTLISIIDFLLQIEKYPAVSALATAAMFIALCITLAIVLERTGTLRKIMRVFFYSEPESGAKSSERITDLETHVANIQKALYEKNITSQRQAIQDELEQQLARNLPEIISRKLEETNAINNSVDSKIRITIENAVSAFLVQQEPSQLLKDRREHLRIQERQESTHNLEKTIQEQMSSSGRIKAVMINLFVLFNIGILLIYIFASATLTDKAVTGIIGLYISLAAFIVYIYRTSNFRSSVLLALREDAKKYFDADDYIKRLKAGASPSDRDVEVLKLLLLNRAEREKMADHPYELVLKGVSNSNIQLKGGKMISSAKNEK